METKLQKFEQNGCGSRLPSISELYNDDGEMSALQKDSVLQVLLNEPPKEQWIKSHPIVKVDRLNDKGQKVAMPLKYIPIERVEWLLTNIFIKWRVEIKEAKLLANSVIVTVRLHYYDHVANEWHWQDGVGAQPLQVDSGAGAIDFMKMKHSAVQMAAPAAESYAVKDAAEKIGRLFGKDLNRAENNISYDSLKDKYANSLDL